MQEKGIPRTLSSLRSWHTSRFMLVMCIFMIFSLMARTTSAKKKSVTPSSSKKTARSLHALSDEGLQNEIEKYLGVKYRRGGNNSNGLDCSGFVKLVYKDAYGVDLPHNSASQAMAPFVQHVPLDDLKEGDLLFFTNSSRSKSKRITHVGIYLSNNLFAHAAQRNGVVISNLIEAYWKARIVGARRIIRAQPWVNEEAQFTSAGLTYISQNQADFYDLRLTLTEFPSAGLSSQIPTLNYPSSGTFPLQLEFNYSKALIDNSWDFHVTAFRRNNFLRPMTETVEGLFSLREFDSARPLFSDESVHGIVLGSDFNPSQWFHITPSMAFVTYTPDSEQRVQSYRWYGIDFTLGPMPDGTSLSLALQYSPFRPKDWDISIFNEINDVLNMSLTYTQKLSNNVLISLMGERLQKMGDGLADTLSQGNTADQRFSFTLNFTY